VQADNVRHDILRQENRIRFLREILDGVMVPKRYANVKAWWQDLAARGFHHDKDPAICPLPVRTAVDLPVTSVLTKLSEDGTAVAASTSTSASTSASTDGDGEDNDEDECGGAAAASRAMTYTYLTNQYMSSLTEGRFKAEEDKLRRLQDRLAEILTQEPAAVWDRELQEFQDAYLNQFMKERMEANAIQHDDLAEGSGAGGAAGRGRAKGVKVKAAKPRATGPTAKAKRSTVLGSGGGGDVVGEEGGGGSVAPTASSVMKKRKLVPQ
jgi:hypothetical protein